MPDMRWNALPAQGNIHLSLRIAGGQRWFDKGARMRGRCHCGDVAWELDTAPESVTACNCTICRRYGALWAYGHINRDIRTSGDTATYRRADGGAVDYHFCPRCGCVTHYVARKGDEEGRHWTAVNLRLTEPEPIAELPIDHFDGLGSFEDLPRDGRRVCDLWF
jgi:hypothetical protein